MSSIDGLQPSQNKEYAEFLNLVKERVRRAQYNALKAVNLELIDLYWDLGRTIAEKQANASWGKSVVERLAKDLPSDEMIEERLSGLSEVE
jgi:DUF1016 N-terminal domain